MTPVPSTNLFGYANNQQQSHMLFYAAADNQIHQLFRYQGSWFDNPLSTLCQQDSGTAPPPPIPGPVNVYGSGTPLTGYAFGNLNYVYHFAAQENSLGLKYVSGGTPADHNWNWGWFDSSNTQPAPGQTGSLPAPAISWGATDRPGPLLAFASLQAPLVQHVIYVTGAGHIVDIYTEGDGLLGRYWKDRTVSTGSLPALRGSHLAGFLDSSGRAQIFYTAQDNSIQHLYEQPDGQWGIGNLSRALPTAPLPASPPRPFAAYICYFENTSRVVYLQAPELQNKLLPVHELYWQNGWIDHEPNLNLVTNTTPAYSSTALAAWSAEYEQSEHVIYLPEITQYGILYELYHTSRGWSFTDLVKSAGLDYLPYGPPIGAPMFGFAADYERTDHVWYMDGNGAVRELYRSGNAWYSGEVAS